MRGPVTLYCPPARELCFGLMAVLTGYLHDAGMALEAGSGLRSVSAEEVEECRCGPV